MENATAILDIGLSQIPRILGFLDDNQKSKTFGCFDRYYWHYKVLDFPNARFQEAVFALSLAYSINSPKNRFYRSATIKRWVMAGVGFWARIRHGDGSLDESYPFERHFCATAFSLYAVTEALLLLGEKAKADLHSTGEFIVRHNNFNVANQMACAAAALYNFHIVTGEQKYKLGFEKKLKSLLSMQARKGFFMEYGGFDAGYDSITLSFLAGLYQKTGRDDLKEAALRCVRNMALFIKDDGYFSVEGMSRKTQFLYPFGFSVFNPDILRKIEKGLGENTILNPSWLDDRYCIPLTANYLLTSPGLEVR